MKQDLDTFLSKIDNIIQQLGQLTSLSDKCIHQYEGSEFEGQEQLVGKLDDLFLIATHEIASQLAFTKEDIIILIRYIDFRKRYPDVSETELKQIVDSENPDIKFKMEIKSKLKNYSIQHIKEDWNKTFDNKSFEKVIKRFT